jgi:hypothetical protein
MNEGCVWTTVISTNTARRIPLRSHASTKLSTLRLAASSFLDRCLGYHQIILKEEDQKKTTFVTPFGAYAYTTMSFGLKNVRATYQRAI